ncbi:unnamed protein product [Microthlaspi erraticum]|uniref:F-box associated beta-propeller type 3 domain-containing protein n=1 Tax=Microthlaspi erraticum TaxID=1685480 RepID=A0A6D2K7V9_9BRAS|nr:unnamed protein product [Microthlaspi erraticum]
MKICGDVLRERCSYTSGLIYFPDIWIKGIEMWDTQPVVCNPITGRYGILPVLMRYRKSKSVLGFNPMGKQFKVVAESFPFCSERDHHKILTLGNGKLGWRSKNSHCPSYRESLGQGICINGFCYFLVDHYKEPYSVILCVHVRSEKFKLIDAGCFCYLNKVKLVNYKGRLGGISFTYAIYDGMLTNTLELCMCVLEDVETQEWSKSVYSLGAKAPLDPLNHYVVGVTSAGEIVLSSKDTTKQFYVFYFSPERNTLQKVEIQGLKDKCSVHVFVDHVEDIDVNDANQLSRPVKEGLEITRKRPVPPKQPKPQKQHTSRGLGKSHPSVKNKQPAILLGNKYELLTDDIE